jgi:regulator of RNase E activity RraA
MSSRPRPQDVSLEGLEYEVRFRDPASFDTVASPSWARATAAAVLDDVAAADVTVRIGRGGLADAPDDVGGGGGDATGLVVSVLLPADGGKTTARERAERVLDAIEG